MTASAPASPHLTLTVWLSGEKGHSIRDRIDDALWQDDATTDLEVVGDGLLERRASDHAAPPGVVECTWLITSRSPAVCERIKTLLLSEPAVDSFEIHPGDTRPDVDAAWWHTLRQMTGLEWVEIARCLGVSHDTIDSWRAGALIPLHRVYRLREIAAAMRPVSGGVVILTIIAFGAPMSLIRAHLASRLPHSGAYAGGRRPMRLVDAPSLSE